MAEPVTGTTTPAATPAPAPSGATGTPATPEFKVPEGQRLVSEADWNARTLESEKLKGYNRVASELGVRSFDELRRWKPAFDAFGKRKLDPDFIARAFGDEAVNDDPAAKREPEHEQIDVKKLERDLISKAESRVEYRMALKDHESAVSRHDDLIKDAVKDLYGEGLSEFEMKRALYSLKASLAEVREKNMYPKGHPLAEYDFQPLTKQAVDQVVEQWKKDMEADKAARLSSKADKFRSAERTRPSTVAGPGTGQGKPEPSRGAGTRELLREKIAEAAAKVGVE